MSSVFLTHEHRVTAAPSGKPSVIKTLSTSSDSIEVVWRPPDASQMNGEFIGHVLSYRPRDRASTQWTRKDLPGNANESTVSAHNTQSCDFFHTQIRSLVVGDCVRAEYAVDRDHE